MKYQPGDKVQAKWSGWFDAIIIGPHPLDGELTWAIREDEHRWSDGCLAQCFMVGNLRPRPRAREEVIEEAVETLMCWPGSEGTARRADARDILTRLYDEAASHE